MKQNSPHCRLISRAPEYAETQPNGLKTAKITFHRYDVILDVLHEGLYCLLRPLLKWAERTDA